MKRLQATRRWLLGALVVMVAATTGLGIGAVSAAEDDGAYYTGGYGSRAGFKRVCENANGTFIDDGNGNTECHFKDGSWTECDANGGDCWHTPPPKKLEPLGTNVEPSSALADDPGSWQPVTDDQDRDRDTVHKRKKGKHGKKGGKGRK